MDQYGKVKSGSLKLKGEKKHKKHKKSKKREHSGDRTDIDEAKKRRREMKEDCEKHGGWWAAEKIYEVAGPVAIQFPNSCYMRAMDNGKFNASIKQVLCRFCASLVQVYIILCTF